MLNMSKTREQMTGVTEDDLFHRRSVHILVSNDEKLIPDDSTTNGDKPADILEEAPIVFVGDECNYTGDLYAEKKHGKGVLSWSDGRMYSGGFFADQRHGFGTFRTPEISEFKGLYCQDERFGPGVLIHQTLSCADVGLWLSENLVRLLYPHPRIHFDLSITDRKSPSRSSLAIPSWYSPGELLRTMTNLELVLQEKSSNFFCNHVDNEQSLLAEYLLHRPDRVEEVMHKRHAQLDAYLISINDQQDEFITNEKSHQRRQVEIFPPNETYEQRQLYEYANKFWPLKQRASFPIEQILCNSRSSFPSPGPTEMASSTLLEAAFTGDESTVRDLLLHRLAYVDVCDSRGLTALHLATYNLHLNLMNTLLDSGCNVNQFSDDGLTPLALAFLLYYGNNPHETTNLALEHIDPPLPKSRLSADEETSNDQEKLVAAVESIQIEEIPPQNSYGYEIKEKLRQHLHDEQFHQSVYSAIVLLLRRGADPSISDWPIPVLAFAVRAGDKHMVELLLKKKAAVNCQLESARHALLTPLHIACGSLEPSAVDIARILLAYGAEVNAESLSGNGEYLSLVDPLVLPTSKMTEKDQHGRTPLHIACTREATAETLALVRLLLEYHADPNAVCNGQSPLSLAIALANESVVDLLLNDPFTDPSTVLGAGNGNALCLLLSTAYESRWPYNKRLKLIERLMAKNPHVLYPVRFGPKNTLASSVDYAYYMFFADTRLSQTPYHALTTIERTVFNERKELLAFIAKRFREEVSKYEQFLRLPTPNLDSATPMVSPSNLFVSHPVSRTQSLLTEKTATNQSWKSSGEFRYCATCGRSTGVRLTLCKRCQKTAFCSKQCKVNGWNNFHRHECRSSAMLNDPSNRLITRTKSFITKGKDVPPLDRNFFHDELLSLKTSTTTNKVDPSRRLPPVSVAKFLREKRLKKLNKLAGATHPALEGVPLSWNHMYNAPENYSFN